MVSSSCSSHPNHNHNTGISNKRRLKANARSTSIANSTSKTSNKNNNITLLRNKDNVHDAVAHHYHPIETSKIETALISYACSSNGNKYGNNNNNNNESLLLVDNILLDSREDDDETNINDSDMDANVHHINNSYDYNGDNKAIIDIICDSWINQCCCSNVISNQTLSPASYKVINDNNKHNITNTKITNSRFSFPAKKSNPSMVKNNENYNEFSRQEHNNAMREEEARDSIAAINVNFNMKLNKFELHIENFKKIQWKGRTCIEYISTYQGRIPGSSNGCTVIAPLLAVQHFFFSNNNNNDNNNNNNNNMIELSNAIIEEVIDIQAPIVLPEVRNMLGLPKDALIVPSDVHDYFLENGLLTQENFLAVCGGNILNPMHLDSLIQLLDNSNASTCRGRGRATKLAATFYFHEHVISILCYPDYNDNHKDNALLGYYEVIDSLPYYNDVINEECNITPANALRIKCYDKEALKITLLWYSIRKFTDDNMDYVQMYEWNERNTDLDPRVFQAFVWISL